MKYKSKFIICCFVLLVLAVFMHFGQDAFAATYYINYANGDNTADGRNPETAWKHAPGDGNATDNPAKFIPEAGDKLIFKGGVAYRGTIRVQASGKPGKPIIYDGNTDNTFGEGRAILDGGRTIANWQRVSSPEEVSGNERWKEIVFADIDADLVSNFEHGDFVVHRQESESRQAPWQRIILYDNHSGLLPIAQSPKPADAFYPDLPADFVLSSHRLAVEEGEGKTILMDPDNLTANDKSYYDEMFIGVHGGNNHVYFAAVRSYDADAHQLTLPFFRHSTYEQTRYALYNSVRLIENPGEWAIRQLEGGSARIYLLPSQSGAENAVEVGYPALGTGIAIESGASYVSVSGFLIQHYSGGAGGVSVASNEKRSRGIRINKCEIRLVSGHAGIGLNYCDEILVEDCKIHHNPGWTTAVFLSRVGDFTIRNNHLEKNSGSGIRHYECKEGVIQDNFILDHFGMHSSAINVYEGCANLVIERNYIHNTATINRNAENITFRNNVIDGRGRASIAFGIWTSGRTGGRDLRNISFIQNTFVNLNYEIDWSAGIFGQSGKDASSPEGLVIRGNILDRIANDLPGDIENNIYTRPVEKRFMGKSNQVVTDLDILFIDAANGDFRRRPGGPAMDAGADIPPPDGTGVARQK